MKTRLDLRTKATAIEGESYRIVWFGAQSESLEPKFFLSFINILNACFLIRGVTGDTYTLKLTLLDTMVTGDTYTLKLSVLIDGANLF